jgi:eukaryotic-like serine/threonine-protein kinase
MSDSRWRRIEEICHQALECETGARADLVRAACGGDESLRIEVESLLVNAAGVKASGLGIGDLGLGLIGQHIGVYQIVSMLGAGGMGEVYRARDTRLGRDVAIKVLPSAFTADPGRLARFEREARLLATLNHPHIGAIYGFEEANGIRALVLELVEGETLAERVARSGRISIEAALPIAGQIAEALEAAHEKGIIHRDLKPSNIKITPDGSVKVLDFGLAKATANSSGPDLPESANLTANGMGEGMIFGTAAYMSPEQARGQIVDKRTDIWAFGCVLYEMLTARATFAAATVSDTIAAIIERQPNWSALPEEVPPGITRLLQRCLEKNPRRRFRDIGDAHAEFEDAINLNARADSLSASRREPKHAPFRWAGITAAFLLGLSVAAGLVWTLRPAVSTLRQVVRFAIEVPMMPHPFSIAVSPDGGTVAFAARQSNGSIMLFVRRIGELEAQSLSGTEGAVHPFWSPDSRHLGFHTGTTTRQLKVVDVAGGAPRILGRNIATFFGGTWNADNVIVFSVGGSLYKVAADGGTPELLNLANPDERHQLWPHFLPDGRHYLYVQWSGTPDSGAIFIGSLDSIQPVRLMKSESMVAFAPPNHLIYRNQRALLSHEFDVSNLALVGEPISIAEDVLYNPNTGRAAFSISHTGTLLYRRGGPETAQRSLIWVNRSGSTIETINNALTAPYIRLSPDGKKVVFAEEPNGGRLNLWIYDLERRLRSQLTDHPAQEHSPAWSPDGQRVGFDSDRAGDHVLYDKDMNRATPEMILLPPDPGTDYGLLDWTSKYILFSKDEDLWALPLSGDRRPFEYFPEFGLKGNANATLSPNGRWLAYVANEGGTNQVFVQSFPDRRERRQQVSTTGGGHPRWSGDGRELFYLDSEWRMISVPVTTEGGLALERSAALFVAPIQISNFGTVGAGYDLARDGQRFLFNVPTGALDPAASITVVMNWMAQLRKP